LPPPDFSRCYVVSRRQKFETADKNDWILLIAAE